MSISSCTKKFGGGIVLKTCSSNSDEDIKYFADVQELIGELRSNKHDHRHCWFKDFIYCIKNEELDPNMKKKSTQKDVEVTNELSEDRRKKSNKHLQNNSDVVETEHDLKKEYLENSEINKETIKEKKYKYRENSSERHKDNLNHKHKQVNEKNDDTEQTYEINKKQFYDKISANHKETLYCQQMKAGNPVPENFFDLDFINEFEKRTKNHEFHSIKDDIKTTTNLTEELNRNETFSEGASTQINDKYDNLSNNTKIYKRLIRDDITPSKFIKQSQTVSDKEEFQLIIDKKDIQNNVIISPSSQTSPKESQPQEDKKSKGNKKLQPTSSNNDVQDNARPEIVSIHDEEEFQTYEIAPRIQMKQSAYANNRSKKTKMDWTDYHRLQDIYQFMEDLEFNYPALCTTTVIGESLEGRPIKLLKISNSNSENSSVWLDAGIHAREWIAPAVATYLANHIVTNFHNLPTYLKNHDWYILPVMNPDGYEYTHTHERMWRKNKAVVRGKLVGVDLNRNFSFDWGGTGSSDDPANSFYRGAKPFSEPESFAVQNFILNSNIKFKVYITLHSYGQLIIFPFASKILPCPDYVRLLEGATIMSKAIFEATGNTYKVGISKDVLYLASGTSHDWSYGVANIPFCYLIELRSKKFKFKLPEEEIKVTCDEVVNAVEKLIEFVADWTVPPKEK